MGKTSGYKRNLLEVYCVCIVVGLPKVLGCVPETLVPRALAEVERPLLVCADQPVSTLLRVLTGSYFRTMFGLVRLNSKSPGSRRVAIPASPLRIANRTTLEIRYCRRRA